MLKCLSRSWILQKWSRILKNDSLSGDWSTRLYHASVTSCNHTSNGRMKEKKSGTEPAVPYAWERKSLEMTITTYINSFKPWEIIGKAHTAVTASRRQHKWKVRQDLPKEFGQACLIPAHIIWAFGPYWHGQPRHVTDLSRSIPCVTFPLSFWSKVLQTWRDMNWENASYEGQRHRACTMKMGTMFWSFLEGKSLPRLFVDYKMLYILTVKDKYKLSQMDEYLDLLGRMCICNMLNAS